MPLAADYFPWELHPTLIHFPISFFVTAVALDLCVWFQATRKREVPQRLLVLSQIGTALLIGGAVMGVLAALAGFLAYATVPLYRAEAFPLLNWHMGIQLGSLALFSWLAFIRWLDWDALPTLPMRILGLVALVLLITGSYIGGYLVYHAGAGFVPAVLAR